MHKSSKSVYEFGPFQMDVSERLLLRDGRVVPLSPKVFDTLLVLVENSGRILAKEELMQKLWPETFVEESNLTQNISQIRRALGEGEFIETIPKRGYRFVAEVRGGAPEDPTPVFAPTKGAVAGGELHLANGSLSRGVIGEGKGLVPGLASVADRDRPLQTTDQLIPPLDPKKVLTSLALLLISLAVLGYALFIAYRRSNNQAKTAFQQITPMKLTTSGKALQAGISRDGKYAAYVVEENDQQSVWVRQVAAMSNASIVAPAEVRILGVTFSPDDNFLYYVVQPKGEVLRELYQVPVLGGTPKKVLSDVDSPVTFSPNGQYIAFVRNYPVAKETSLIMFRLDGSEERKLVTRKRPEMLSMMGPSWSPDGRLIACAAGNSANGDLSLQILAVNPDDGSARPMDDQNWTFIGQVAWLGDSSGVLFTAWQRSSAVYGDQLWLLAYPNGQARRITNDITSYEGVSVSADSSALVSRRMDRVSRIWVVPKTDAGLDSSRATQIQSGFGDNYSEQFGLDWTPDGRLVYASHASGNLDIWSSSTDGKQQKQLTRDPLTDVSPTASADGRYVVFLSDRGGYSTVWRMDVDGGNPRQLTKGKGDASPTISPDGRWVVYSSAMDGKWFLRKVPIEGGEPVPLSGQPATRPVISPDGKWIACYFQNEKEGKTRIGIMPFEGGDPKILEQMALPEYNLFRWSPDSRSLTYIVTRQGVSNLWSQLIEGGEPKQLTEFTTDQIFRFAWSHDGKFLACERGIAIKDIVLIRSSKPE